MAFVQGVKSLFFVPVRGWKQGTETTAQNPLFNTPDIMERAGFNLEYTIKQDPNFYQLDGVIKENYESVTTLTRNPVETGVIISDHSFREPYVVTVDGIITNSPTILQFGNRIPGSNQLFGTDTGGIALANNAANIFSGNRIRDAWIGLNELKNKSEILTLYTGLAVYQNMVLTRLTTVNDEKNQLRVNMTFTEALTVDQVSGSLSINTISPAVVGVDLQRIVNTVGLALPGSSVSL